MKIWNHGDGLADDLLVLQRRLDGRQILRLFAGARAATVLYGCGNAALSPGGSDAGTGGGSGTCSEVPSETGGPYTGDGRNGPNALTTEGIIRTDIRSSFAGMSGTAEGMPLTVALTIVNANANCAPLAGHAVYIWHCDKDGQYSLYTAPSQNYLRGVAETDDAGVVTFTSIFPGCYAGRWPHIHFEIFSEMDAAMSGRNAVKTSQIALPKDACNEVFQTAAYSASVR